MIIMDRQEELSVFIHELTGGMYPLESCRFIGYTRKNKIISCVAATDYTGGSVGFHVASIGIMPLHYLKFCFEYAFNILKVNKILTTVSSENKKSLKFSLHLGFVIEHTIKQAGRIGNDLHILSLKKEQSYILNKMRSKNV